jgi:hypothetical protein
LGTIISLFVEKSIRQQEYYKESRKEVNIFAEMTGNGQKQQLAPCLQRVMEKSIKFAGTYTPKTANFKKFLS